MCIRDRCETGQVGNTTVRSICSSSGRTTVCRLNRSMLGQCDGVGDPGFGYPAGEPCVLLKLNRVMALETIHLLA